MILFVFPAKVIASHDIWRLPLLPLQLFYHHRPSLLWSHPISSSQLKCLPCITGELLLLYYLIPVIRYSLKLSKAWWTNVEKILNFSVFLYVYRQNLATHNTGSLFLLPKCFYFQNRRKKWICFQGSVRYLLIFVIWKYSYQCTFLSE